MRLSHMGPPSAGEGTQAGPSASGTASRPSPPVILPGQRLGHTYLGVTAQPYMSAGEYVPDEVTNATVRDRLALSDRLRGFLPTATPAPRAGQGLDVMLADLIARRDGAMSTARIPHQCPEKVAEAEAWAIQHWNVVEVGDR